MKRLLLFALLLGFSSEVFAITPEEGDSISEVISFARMNLDKPVPSWFIMITRNYYAGDPSNIILYAENGAVKAILIGGTHQTSKEAFLWQSSFYQYFEGEKWEFVNNAGIDGYYNDGLYFFIFPPYRGDDGLTVALVTFLYDLEYLDKI
jgi:hypothetical protein